MAYLDKVKEEIYSKVTGAVLIVVTENASNFVTKIEPDIVEQLVVYYDHAVKEVVYMQIDLLVQEIHDDFSVAVVIHQAIVTLPIILAHAYDFVKEKDLYQIKGTIYEVELKVVRYHGSDVDEQHNEVNGIFVV